MADTETQMDRIERKLDEVLALRDLLLRFTMPRMPEAMRSKVAVLLARKQGP
jgi:hypothetical protein